MPTDPTPLASNREWQDWGARDPFWAVATEPDKRQSERAAWTSEDFYAAGEADWKDFFPHWQRYGVNPQTGLEIGCGAGRLTRAAAGHFQALHAVDVSPGMIACAQQALSVAPVTFHLTNGLGIPLSDATVTAIFSTHVFQHLDGEANVLAYFSECHRVLAPQGTIMVHVPLYEWPGYGKIAAILRSLHAGLRKISDARAWFRRRLGWELMRSTAVNSAALYPALRGMGFRDIEFKTVVATRNNALHSFVFARKAEDLG